MCNTIDAVTKLALIRQVADTLDEDPLAVWEIIESFLYALASAIRDERDVALPWFGRFTVQPDGAVAFSPSAMRFPSREVLAEDVRSDALNRLRLPTGQSPLPARPGIHCEAVQP